MYRHLRLFFRALWCGLVGLLISLSAAFVWTVLIRLNLGYGEPWSVPVMALILWLMWRYWGGAGWPRSTSATRRRYRRANPVSAPALIWSVIAGVLGIVALAGYWIVFTNLFKMKPNVIPDSSAYPALMIYPMMIMGSLVSPFSEEAGFRGYSQLMLERDFRPAAAAMIASVFFAIGHLNHGFYWPKQLIYFLVGVTFAAIVTLTNSILASIPVHIIGDMVFFLFVWPHDATRRLVREQGTDGWFWIHFAQAIVFTVLSILAFKRLAAVGRTDSLTTRAAGKGTATA